MVINVGTTDPIVTLGSPGGQAQWLMVYEEINFMTELRPTTGGSDVQTEGGS